MSSPIFSVIITTCNRRDLLPYAIQSILDQTFQDFELLIIDNGSTDDTRYVMSCIKDDRIKYILNPSPTQSCDAPRNLGIELAQGEFISFLDDDDIWYPEKLEKVKKVFDENLDVSAVCHYENKSVHGKIEGMLKYGPWCDYFYEKLLYEGNCLSPSALTIKAELLKKYGGFDLRREIDGAADYELWLRLATQGVKFYFIEESLGECRITGNNLSMIDPIYPLKTAYFIKKHLLAYEGKIFFKLSRRGLWRISHLYLIAMRSFLKRGDLKGVFKCFFKAGFLFLMRPFLIFNLCSKLLRIQH